MDALTSPLLRPGVSASSEATFDASEVAALIEFARARGAQAVAIGSGRGPLMKSATSAFEAAWEQSGGELALRVTWPESAASWLRQATRFAAAEADVWVMFGPPLGWAQMTRRLLWSTPWKPSRTLLAGGVSERDTLDLVGLFNLPGIAGVTSDGQPWHLGVDDRIIAGRGSGS
jgi:hypothetical protein